MDAEICLNYSVELNVAVKLAKLSSIVTGLSLLVKSYVLQVMIGLVYWLKILYENYKVLTQFSLLIILKLQPKECYVLPWTNGFIKNQEEFSLDVNKPSRGGDNATHKVTW